MMWLVLATSKECWLLFESHLWDQQVKSIGNVLLAEYLVIMIVTPKLGKLLFMVWMWCFCAAYEIAYCTILKCLLPCRLDMLQICLWNHQGIVKCWVKEVLTFGEKIMAILCACSSHVLIRIVILVHASSGIWFYCSVLNCRLLPDNSYAIPLLYQITDNAEIQSLKDSVTKTVCCPVYCVQYVTFLWLGVGVFHFQPGS